MTEIIFDIDRRCLPITDCGQCPRFLSYDQYSGRGYCESTGEFVRSRGFGSQCPLEVEEDTE